MEDYAEAYDIINAFYHAQVAAITAALHRSAARQNIGSEALADAYCTAMDKAWALRERRLTRAAMRVSAV